ncbi:MAG: hypothetical protein HRF42_13445 [Candidatus Brocadia sp.]|jgi:hypothetical protein
MFFKICTDFFSKNLFYLLVVVSLAIHAILIFMSPQANQILGLRSLRDSFIREPSEYAVTLELENADAMEEELSSPATKLNENRPKKEEDAEKKKYKIFTDTSENIKDEETTADTDKIGEKGAVARDNFPDDKQLASNEPRAEGRSKVPLLGKGKTGTPYDSQPQLQEQEITPATVIPEVSTQDKNTPPRYANLPKGLEKQESSPVKSLQMVQSQISSEERKENTTEEKTIKPDKAIKTEEALQPSKRERLTIGRGIRQEEVESLPYSNGVLFTDRQDKVNRKAETEEELLPSSFHRQKTTEKTDTKAKKISETREMVVFKPEIPGPPQEPPGAEPQRRLERGLDEQESPAESKNPKVSFNVNAKTEGANNNPVLFEDTISNAAIPGAPSFNVKKHEYADYFKHIRDRISLYWFLGYGTRAEIKLATRDDKPIIIEFKVLPNGSIDGVKIVDDAGNFNLASRLISSIKNAAPLNPFPPHIKEPSIDVRFNFYFF